MGAILAVLPMSASAQAEKPPLPPPVEPSAAAAAQAIQPTPALPALRGTKPVVVGPKDPGAPGAPSLPTSPNLQNEPLYIPELPAGPGGSPQSPPLIPGVAPQAPQRPQGPQGPPLQRIYQVGKFVIQYGTDVQKRNPKLPTEDELSASVVTLIEGQDRKLFHLAKTRSAGAAKAGGPVFGTTTAAENVAKEQTDEDQALHPPAPPAVAPVAVPAAKPGAKIEPKQSKKAAAIMEKNIPKAIPKPLHAEGTPVSLKVSDFSEPRLMSAMAMLDVYDAVVKKLTDRGLIGITDERMPGVMDVKVTVFISEVAKIRTIARKIPFQLKAMPKLNDDDAPDGQPVKDPKHLWIKAKSPVFVSDPKKPGGPLEKPRLQDYLSRLNRFPGRRVDAAINATGETGKVMLDYLIREQKNYVIYAQESNNGTKATGEWRSRLGVELRQLLNKDDILRLEYTTTDLEQFNSGVLSYQFALVKPDVLKMKVYGLYGQFSAEDVGFSGASFKGDSLTAGLALTWTPKYWHGFPLDITLGGEFMRVTVDNEATGGKSAVNFILPYLGVGTERTTEKFSLATFWQVKGGFDQKNQDQLNGLGRFETDGAFWYLTGDLAASIYLEPLLLGKKWGDLGKDGTKWTHGILANELAVIAHGQYTLGNRRIVPQLALIAGGYNTVRGYPESFASGDTGFVSSFEYRLHVPRLFKPSDVSKKQQDLKDMKDKERAAAVAGKVAKTSNTPKAAAATPVLKEPKVEVATDTRGGNSPSFRLRPGGAGAGADWDLILRGFLDVGHTYNNRIQSTVEKDRLLVSTGGGIELQLFKPIYMTIRADYGYVLQAQRELLLEPVEVGDSRFHISATIAW
jgi:hemolysin activation/secretion protein